MCNRYQGAREYGDLALERTGRTCFRRAGANGGDPL